MRTIERGLALSYHVHMPLTSWSYPICIVFFLLNRLSFEVLSKLSPFKMLYGKVSSYNELKVFDF